MDFHCIWIQASFKPGAWRLNKDFKAWEKKAKFEFKPRSAIYYLGERSLTSLSSPKTSRSPTITAGFDGGDGGGVSPLPLRIFAQRSRRWNLPWPPTPDLLTYVSTHHLSPSNASHLFGYDLSPQQRHKPPEYGEFHLLYFLLYPQRLGHIWPRLRFQTYLTEHVNSSELIHPSAENHTLWSSRILFQRCKNGSISGNQSMWYSTLTKWRIKIIWPSQ